MLFKKQTSSSLNEYYFMTVIESTANAMLSSKTLAFCFVSLNNQRCYCYPGMKNRRYHTDGRFKLMPSLLE